jgi:hypothetical protein
MGLYSQEHKQVRVRRGYARLDGEWAQSWAQSEMPAPPREESRNSDGYGRLTTHETSKFFSPFSWSRTLLSPNFFGERYRAGPNFFGHIVASS